MQKLEHMSEKKMSGRGVGSYVSSTFAPTRGKRKGGGQKIGELDMYSLLAWDCPTIIDEFFGPLSADHKIKNEMISEMINTGTTNYKESKADPVREKLDQLMLSIHIENT